MLESLEGDQRGCERHVTVKERGTGESAVIFSPSAWLP